MSALTDLKNVQFTVLDGPGFTEDEAYALLVGADRSTSDVPTLVAAFWNSKDHPRDRNGMFIDKDRLDAGGFDGRAVTAARTKESIRKATPQEFGGLHVRSSPPNREFAQAVDTYMSGAFTQINAGLRRSKGNPAKVEGAPGASATAVNGTQNVRETIKSLDRAMAESRLRDDVLVSRGIVKPAEVFGKMWGDDVTGLTWRDHGFASTSPDRAYARNYATKSLGDNTGVMMNVLVPRGTSAIYVQENLEGNTHHELVLDRDLRYRVVRDRGVVDGIRTLDVEVSRD